MIKLGSVFFLLLLTMLVCSCDSKQSVLSQNGNNVGKGFVFVAGGKFGIISLSGDTLIAPTKCYISQSPYNRSDFTVYLGSGIMHISIADQTKILLKSIMNTKGVSAVGDANRRQAFGYCDKPRMDELCSKITILDSPNYVEYISHKSCDGYRIRVIGDKYYYVDSMNVIQYQGSIPKGQFVLEKRLTGYTSDGSNTSDSIYYNASLFYDKYLKSMMSDLSCDTSEKYNYYICD